MKIEYKSSVYTQAGHRSVYIVATAKRISEKQCEVVEVLTIDDEAPSKYMSRTGSRRQQYDGVYTANNEIGKIKRISSLFIVLEE